MTNIKLSIYVLLLITCSCSVSESQVSDPIYKLIWNDEFDGNQVDTAAWNNKIGAHGWGNNEWQNYTDGDNAEVSNGTLKIIAKKIGDGQKVGDYTSTRMTTKKSWKYGIMEIKAKIPSYRGNGLWPAIWMLGKNIESAGWPNCGEIDIMEYVSYDPNHVHQTIHSKANNHMIGTQVSTGPKLLTTIEEDFHTYGIIWNALSISFYIDDVSNILLRFDKPANANLDNWPFDQPFFFILNLAVGGNWGGRKGVDDFIFPATFEIDYVRVYGME